MQSRTAIKYKRTSYRVWISTAAIALLLASCATTIPGTDTTQPELRLSISGPGIGNQEMTNPPREVWTGPGGVQYLSLQPGVRYNFIFSVSDQGGVERANLRLPAEFSVSGLAPADVSETTSGFTRSLTLTGTRSDPRTALVISGSFVTSTTPNLVFTFNTEGDDFGGSAGRSNQRFMNVEASVFAD